MVSIGFSYDLSYRRKVCGKLLLLDATVFLIVAQDTTTTGLALAH
jgi:hypothetical protein